MKNSKRLTPEDFRYMESKVLEWNTLFGNSLEDDSLIEVYQGLVEEECKETFKALKENNVPEIIDGLCDLMYVAGFLWLLKREGLDTTFLNDVSKGGYDFIGEIRSVITKNLSEIVVTTTDSFALQTYVVSLLSEVSLSYNILEAFNRVSESNFSKAISKKDVDSGKIDLDECVESVYDGGRYDEVYYEPCGDYFIIKAKVDKEENKTYPTGKVCKGFWYKSVEDLGGLEEFIY